jgi:uncharacterized repeat protein (TIGR03803 family)
MGKMPQGESTSLGRGHIAGKSRHRRAKLNTTARAALAATYHAEALERRVLLSGLATVASFEEFPFGANPTSTLAADGNGNLYGTAQNGGAYNDGTVFEWAKATNSISLVANFNGANGRNPFAGVTFDTNGNIYGTTTYGGASNDGTVFEILAGSNTITTLGSFNGANGANPYAGVWVDGAGNVYGAAVQGGAQNDGTFFEIVAGSGMITPLVTFNGTNGSNPNTAPVPDGQGNLYGTASSGGVYGDGEVYEIAAGANMLRSIISFNGADGGVPFGGIVMDKNGNIYGTTTQAGFNGGEIYEIAAGRNVITVLTVFDPDILGNPEGTLLIDGAGNLYGTATQAGYYDDGAVFELASGSNSVTLVASESGLTGLASAAGLVMDGSGNLYGTAPNGGSTAPAFNYNGSEGAIFEIAQGSNSITDLYAFGNQDLWDADRPLIADSNGNIYGITEYGGTNAAGTVFEVAAGTNAVTPLVSFPEQSPELVYPSTTLDDSGNIFGTTLLGNTVFEIAKGSDSITTLANFGSSPGGLQSPGFDPDNIALDGHGNIFGIDEELGPGNGGAVWELAHGSNIITLVAPFNGDRSGDGPGPTGIVVDPAGNIYGATIYGGDGGTIFEVADGANTITTVATFNNTDGNGPSRIVMDGNGNIFGATTWGGQYNDGTIFELVAGSTTILTLASFNGVDGANPDAGVVLDAAGNIFGTTTAGGGFLDGTVFELPHGSNKLTTLATFNGVNGADAATGVTIDPNGNLFGTTLSGGQFDNGNIFELPDVPTVAPAISSYAVNGGTAQRSMLTQATIVFNQPVNLATGAISLTQRATGGGSPTPITFTQATSDNTTWNLTFPTYTGGSLPDGIFDLTVTAADVSSISAPTLTMTGGNQTFTFDRPFGDSDGNGIVNNADYFQFKKTYGQASGSANYNPVFDYDANGIVNNADYFQFKKRYGQQIVIAAENSDSSDAALLSSSDSSSNDRIAARVLQGR